MSDPESPAGGPDPTASATPEPDSVTRGFLFSDLRGYTHFVETHGAAPAAELLVRYRALVRAAIARFGGAEIKTEGDSFYVVFSSVSSAVRCGLAITSDAAAASSEHAGEPIHVGVGIHAGETVESDGGYVGSAVNIAARICAQAASGEVLVSETVRALTRSLLAVRFKERGRRQLKGIADPIALFAVFEAAPGAAPGTTSGGRRLRGRRLIAASLGGAVLVAGGAAFGWVALHPAGLPPGAWRIGLDMPLSGPAAFRGKPMLNSAQLAIGDANKGGGVLDSMLTLKSYDDGGVPPNSQVPDRGAANASTMIADPRTIAMIGPSGSNVARAILPLTNQAGLFECSPANTSPGLTKPRDGALDLRSAHPDKINYVRLAPSDDVQALALASFAFRDLKARVALVIDDAGDGRDIADGFQQEYTALGGLVVRRALNKGADPMTVLGLASDGTQSPQVVFFGGFTETGAAQLRAAMGGSGLGAVPFLSWDGILDGTAADPGSFIQLAGSAAVGSHLAHASLGPHKASFAEAYRAAYGEEPDEYSAAAYACMEIIVASLRQVATQSPSAENLREALRAHATDTSHQFATILGTVGFDTNGDSTQQFVTFYRVDAGDWVIDKQQDFGPAR
ncbi:MAG: ABC transporter substrate-binding protein [Chloroflexota bacterium]|nr:ABC transporter substrate-binding protein [Chloroflexota bacterium]